MMLQHYERFAPFKTLTQSGALAFNGVGSETAGEAMQREIAEMTRLLYLEARDGRALPDSAPTGLDGFQADVMPSLIAADLERMRGLMSDPFTFAYWQSEGAIATREEALALLKDALAQRGNLGFEPHDLIQKLHWREYAEDGSKLVRALRVTGWQSSAPEAEAVVLIYQRPAGSFVWTALVISHVGLP
jgi:hypothetical protein